jgi:integrase
VDRAGAGSLISDTPDARQAHNLKVIGSNPIHATNFVSKIKKIVRRKAAFCTLHDEIVTLRMVLKTAIRRGWLQHLPDRSPPYKTQGKVVRRPWFSPEEYKQLYEAARAYAKEPFNGRFKWNAEQVYDFILFMANTGLRPDEAFNLQHRDVAIVTDDATGSQILEIEVRGKRGVGHCKSMPGAVRVCSRPKPVQGETRRQRQQRRKEGGESPPPQRSNTRSRPTCYFLAITSSCLITFWIVPASNSTVMKNQEQPTAFVTLTSVCD